MCLCYLFSAKTARQLVNRKGDFFYKTNRELECSVTETVSLLCNRENIITRLAFSHRSFFLY